MRTNSVKKALREGKSVVAIAPGFPSPEMVEFLGLLGFDCIFLDAEHGVISADRTQDLVRAADAVGVPTLTRVPTGDPALILPYLETGTGGVIVPHINSAQAAEQVVQAVKYSPLGTRGGHSGTRAANYGITQSGADYFAQANREMLVAVMIEETSALENLDDILQVPDLDMCFIGPGDLSLSMGLPGQPDHPDVQREVERALQKIRQSKVAAGTVASDGTGVRKLFERGFQFALVSAPKPLGESLRRLLGEARQV